MAAPARFTVPRIPNATLGRPALLARLDEPGDSTLTLVSAGPGSGKSALLAAWAATLPSARWLTCESDHADEDSFWSDLARAIDPDGMEILDEVDPRARVLALVDTLRSAPTTIVIDDFHNARPAPGDMMALVGSLPEGVRLVVSTRVDPPLPLGRLRVQGRLLELRQSDLRFSPDETAALLDGYGVRMSATELGQLDDLTDGWTAGVQLAGLSLQANPRPVQLLKNLSETNRSLVDFLMNEVIDLQSEEMRDFLMVTAELETFDAALCDAVRGSLDSAALLDKARAANLFLVQIDPDDGWFRYHHLFGRFLQARMRAVSPPERRAELHRRAAAACRERSLFTSGIRHYAEAADMESARALILAYASDALSFEDRDLAREVSRAWLREFGVDALERVPTALLECAFVLASTTTTSEAEQWLKKADDRLASLDAHGRFLIHAVWAFHLLRRGDPTASLERSRLAAEVIAEGGVDTVWALATPVTTVQAMILLDDLDGARRELELAAQRAAGFELLTEVRLPGLGSLVAAHAGELGDAERLAQHALAGADRLELSARNYGRAAPLLALAMVSLAQGDLDGAEAMLESSLRIAEEGARPPIELLDHLTFARIAIARGDLPSAEQRIGRARTTLPAPNALVLDRIDRVEAELAAARGNGSTSSLRQEGLVDPLSDRERTVLRCLAGSQDSTAIADSLYLSVNTVRTHVKSIYRKLGVRSRSDAVATARELGLV